MARTLRGAVLLGVIGGLSACRPDLSAPITRPTAIHLDVSVIDTLPWKTARVNGTLVFGIPPEGVVQSKADSAVVVAGREIRAGQRPPSDFFGFGYDPYGDPRWYDSSWTFSDVLAPNGTISIVAPRVYPAEPHPLVVQAALPWRAVQAYVVIEPNEDLVVTLDPTAGVPDPVPLGATWRLRLSDGPHIVDVHRGDGMPPASFTIPAAKLNQFVSPFAVDLRLQQSFRACAENVEYCLSVSFSALLRWRIIRSGG